MTDEAIRKIIGNTLAKWFDYGDKDTWFKDPELSVPAIYPEDVRYVKDKVGPGYVKVERIEMDEHGRYYRNMEV